MTTDIKGLMKEARGWHAGHSNDSQRMVWLMNKLCDALEAMAGEVVLLREAMMEIDPHLDEDTEAVQRFRKALEATK